jgi:hypothetical protein
MFFSEELNYWIHENKPKTANRNINSLTTKKVAASWLNYQGARF